jgi:uncharacterized membrane protein YbhN (UPF0104 family)/nucleotide-binding universal stress UspA family protein
MSALPAASPDLADSGRRAGRSGTATRLATTGLLAVLALSLVLALPSTRGVAQALVDIDPGWVAFAVALELASEASFVVIFRLFFDRVAPRDARALAWTSMASGALLPAGGVGGYAVGGWLARLTGAPTSWIVQRSSGLFWLTSGVNAAVLIGAGLLLTAGVPGPHDFAHAELPAILAAAATLAVLALPALPRRRGWTAQILEGIRDAQRAARHPSWRLLGAVGYLLFDIAVLWLVLAAVGERMPVAALVLGYQIGYLGAALPIPGGVGALDAGLTGALVLYGASPAHAAAAVLVYHAIALWVPGLGGLYAYVRLRPRLVAPSAAAPVVLTAGPRRMLVGFDGSPPARAALTWASDLARRTHGSLTVVLAVVPPWWSFFPGLAGAAYELERSTISTLKGAVAELAPDVSVAWLVSHDPVATALRREAARQGSDAIVIGSHRRRWHGWLERSLRRHAPAPVIAVPGVMAGIAA